MMDQQLQTRASPATGLTIAYNVMADAVTFHLANGGPASARAHIEILAKELIIYEDCHEAYRAAMARISEAEREAHQQAEVRQQQQMNEMMLKLANMMHPQAPEPTQDKGTAVAHEPLPEVLASEQAMGLWDKMQEAGIVDKYWQPVKLSRTEAAVLADELSSRLKLKNKWQPFEQLWNRRNMSSDHQSALRYTSAWEFRKRLKTILGE